MLKEAEVSLDPLCVIAGVNDNGKSTIGKVVFCIIKAINRYKEDLKVSKDHEIKKLIADAYFELRPLTEDRDTSFSWFDFRIILMNDNELKDSVPIFRQFLLKGLLLFVISSLLLHFPLQRKDYYYALLH